MTEIYQGFQEKCWSFGVPMSFLPHGNQVDVEPVRDRGKMFHARVGGAKDLPYLGDGLQPKGRSKTHGDLHLNREVEEDETPGRFFGFYKVLSFSLHL